MIFKTSARKYFLAALLFGIIAIGISLRGSSLWIDEGITYDVVRQDFKDYVRSMIDLSAGSAQCGMPLYISIEWLWIRLFGTSELAMRSSNVLFIIPFLFYAAKSLKKLNLSPWYMALFALNSVFLYYINEARPYALLLSAGMAFFYYVMLCDLNNKNTLAKMYISFFLGLTTHMMFVFMFAAYLVRYIYLVQEGKLDFGLHIRILLRFMLPLLILIAYYVYVLLFASEVNNQTSVPISGILQILYFFAGFSGMALNRNHLNDLMLSELKIEHFFLLLLLLMAYVGMFAFLLSNHSKKIVKTGENEALPFSQLVASFLTVLMLFLVTNIIFKTRFWERHCIYLLPFVLMLICKLLDGMFLCEKKSYRCFAALMVLMQLLSAGRLMLNPYYAKEDYQGVAYWFHDVEETAPYTLLYQGSNSVFDYYGWGEEYADLSDGGTGNLKMPINHFTVQDVYNVMEKNPGVYYLVLSEKESFDSQNIYDQFESSNRFQCFKIVRIETSV